VVPVREGEAFTSISHGLSLASKRTSKPYNSKQCLSLIITFETDCSHLMISSWTLEKPLLTSSCPYLDMR